MPGLWEELSSDRVSYMTSRAGVGTKSIGAASENDLLGFRNHYSETDIPRPSDSMSVNLPHCSLPKCPEAVIVRMAPAAIRALPN